MKPSDILNSAIDWLDTYLEIIGGGNIQTQRRRLIWLMPVSLLAPLGGILPAWLVKVIGLGPLSPLVVILTFIAAIVPWLFLLWLTMALYAPLIILTIPTEWSSKLKELNASPENAKKLAWFFADIIAWILFAGLYCYFWRVWNNILAAAPLLFVTLFLLFAAAGKWVVPSPKFKRKLWLAAVVLVFLPVTLSFLTPNFYYHVFGHSPSELSNKFPESQNSLEKLNKAIWEEKDEELAESLKAVRKMVEKGKISPDSGRVLAEQLSQQIRQKSLLNQGKQEVDSLIQKVKGVWPRRKDTSTAEVVVTPPRDEKKYHSYFETVGPGETEIPYIRPRTGERFEVVPCEGLKWKIGKRDGNVLKLQEFGGLVKITDNCFDESVNIFSPRQREIEIRRFY